MTETETTGGKGCAGVQVVEVVGRGQYF